MLNTFALHQISKPFSLSSPPVPMLYPPHLLRPFSLHFGANVTKYRALFAQLRLPRLCSAMAEMPELMDYLERLKNYERIGVPRGAGTESDDGFDLGRMRRLLGRLGDPHAHFKSIHIAGTKGKGSVAAFISNILRNEGYKVGTYTSPHMLTIRERISIGREGEPVSANLLNNLFLQVKGKIDESVASENGALSHFEVFTALAFLVFSHETVDVAVVEAGLGGARDATNVIRSSELAFSIITSIGKEHLEALGGSLQSIAMAKSGIIKEGRPVVIGGPLEPDIERIIREKAQLLDSPVLSVCHPGVSCSQKQYQVDYERPVQICDIGIEMHNNMEINLQGLKLQMLGIHQLRNAVMATCAALCLRNQGLIVSNESIRAGLEQTCLQGRMQFLTKREASSIGADNISLLIDGAHTEASAKGLSEVIEAVHQDHPLALVVAMASDKDHFSFAKQLLSGRKPDVVLLTEVTVAGGKSRSISALDLKDIWMKAAQDVGIDIFDLDVISPELEEVPNTSRPVFAVCSNTPIRNIIAVASKLIQTRGKRDESGLVCVTGSLHLVSSLLSILHL
ncbi:Folylpolyglutamate synthase [Rhynchospora pubera]|uniref:Folylpolyglutamate synthase n=1 Tax=Rhynchospora pubera TaxID=906938 RepID=A0AAV8HL52_9POAL|nr:Folylpolyglutamate synthase [Rhynchospora pubera]